MDPRNPEVGEEVEITVTVENIGNADWSLSTSPLSVVFEDGTGYEKAESVSESIFTTSFSDTFKVFKLSFILFLLDS